MIGRSSSVNAVNAEIIDLLKERVGPMSKRTDSIRSMFSVPKEEALSADNKASPLPRLSSGSVRSLRDTFSDVEKENEELRAQLASGQLAIDLDPEPD